MISIRPMVGVVFCTYLPPALRAVAGVVGACELFGHAAEFSGAPSSEISVPSCGLFCATDGSRLSVEHDASTEPRRIGPCASASEKIAFALWFAHATQKR